MTKLRRVRRILISSKDVTGVTSEKSDAVKFAKPSQAKMTKKGENGENKAIYRLLTKQYYALNVDNK